MAPRREILDSEDDGSDFGDNPIEEPAEAGANHEIPRDEAQNTLNASHNVSSDSTDLSFFQQIYDQQQAAADGQDLVHDTTRLGASGSAWTDVSSAPPPGQKPRPSDISSLTPVTDPVPPTRRSKRSREVQQPELIDLTDMVTPRKEAASGASDVWNLPSSAASQRNTRTYGKRKSGGQQSSPQPVATSDMPSTEDPYSFPDATPRARKKAKRGTPPSSASPVLLVPTGEAEGSSRRTLRRRGRDDDASLDSNMLGANTSLYIAQSALTASQKQEYRMVSQSSDAQPDTVGQSLPTQQFVVGEIHKSSGATTIAYPTPSRVVSSRLASTDMFGDDVAATALSVQEANIQQSSPDVLTDMSALKATRTKRSRAKVASSAGFSECDPPVSARKSKKRKITQSADDLQEKDPLEGIGGTDDSLLHGKEAGHATVEKQDIESNDQAYTPVVEPPNLDSAPPPPPTQKKRGRKKKDIKPRDSTPEIGDPSSLGGNIPEPAIEQPEPSEKRRRGRPRKAETSNQAPSVPTQPEPEPLAEARALSELPHNSQSGSQPYNVKSEGGDGEGKENGPAAATPDVETVKMAKMASDTKDKGKEKAPKQDPNQKLQLKVQYRVGLSKRSRIAPLLKSLKKPS